MGALQNPGVYVWAIERRQVLDAILCANLGGTNVGGIADDDVEAAAMEDAVKLDEPVERLVRLYPTGVGSLVAYLDAVLASEAAVKFVFECLEPLLEFLFVGGGYCA